MSLHPVHTILHVASSSKRVSIVTKDDTCRYKTHYGTMSIHVCVWLGWLTANRETPACRRCQREEKSAECSSSTCIHHTYTHLHIPLCVCLASEQRSSIIGTDGHHSGWEDNGGLVDETCVWQDCSDDKWWYVHDLCMSRLYCWEC